MFLSCVRGEGEARKNGKPFAVDQITLAYDPLVSEQYLTLI